MMSARHSASAPAKVILFGEHFVVYGNPSILAAINRRITVTVRAMEESKIVIKSDIGVSGEYSGSKFMELQGGRAARPMLDPLHSAVENVLATSGKKFGIRIDMRSQVPHSVGLGSSAAACVATVAAVDSLFRKHDRQWVCERAVEAERLIHKDSSGADCYVSAYGGMTLYRREEGFRRIKAGGPLWIVIGNTGVRHSTGDLVSTVRKFKEANGSLFRDLSKQASDICKGALAAILSDRREVLGRRMSENQALLRQIGVSHKEADRLIETCLNAGALGAKITGAGGGGAVIALAATKWESAKIAKRIRASGKESIEAELDFKGLVV
ncbi:MAG: mevalonate kinase [Nitrososphaera sp.]|nr:mevalonate kinase [Nitrososphaera sp.]